MNENVFRRVELKYLIDDKQLNKFLNLIDKYIEQDLYFHSNILNIYYDNENADMIIKSIEKPIFKEKVRIRSYGIPKLDDKIYVEIKKKYKGIVSKRRETLKLKEFYNFEQGKYDESKQILKEINYLFKKNKLKPYIFVGYQRDNYKSKEGKIRITIDSNLKYRKDNLRLEYGDKGKNYFTGKKRHIVEIKIDTSMPLWLSNALSKCKIYKQSFSKVGNIYKKEILENVK